jgi:uncharacterized protein YheU (UPF0270 family)
MTSTKGPRLVNNQSVDEGRILSISCENLSSETLRAVIEEYVTRNGTDYGEVEVPLEQKVRQVHRELKSGKAFILFDTIDQTCNIVSKDDFQKSQSK